MTSDIFLFDTVSSLRYFKAFVISFFTSVKKEEFGAEVEKGRELMTPKKFVNTNSSDNPLAYTKR